MIDKFIQKILKVIWWEIERIQVPIKLLKELVCKTINPLIVLFCMVRLSYNNYWVARIYPLNNRDHLLACRLVRKGKCFNLENQVLIGLVQWKNNLETWRLLAQKCSLPAQVLILNAYPIQEMRNNTNYSYRVPTIIASS